MPAACDYQSGDFIPDMSYGVCMAQPSVPAGCPIYFVTTQMVATNGFTIGVSDAQGHPVTATATTTAHGTGQASDTYTDFFDCSCPRVTDQIQTFQFATSIPAAKAGDVVMIQMPSESSPNAMVQITAAAPCPSPSWDVAFSLETPCDLCPGDPPGDPMPPHSPGGAGCSIGGQPGLAIALFAAFVALRRRR